jgi:hypothetical protein
MITSLTERPANVNAESAIGGAMSRKFSSRINAVVDVERSALALNQPLGMIASASAIATKFVRRTSNSIRKPASVIVPSKSAEKDKFWTRKVAAAIVQLLPCHVLIVCIDLITGAASANVRDLSEF